MIFEPQLDPPDSHHVQAAEGWVELNHPREALRELELLSPAARKHSSALDVRWNIHAKLKEWETCVELARELAELQPKNIRGWIHWAYALHELKRTEEARAVLEPQLKKFPREYLFRYNLACYEAQLGRPEQAWQWLTAAIKLGDARLVRAIALDDPDLAPLRDRIREM